MASKALTCSTSPLVSNRASRGPLSAGFGPRSVVLSWAPSPRKFSLVVRAAQDDPQTPATGGGPTTPPAENVSSQSKVEAWNKRPALVNSPRYVRSPWSPSDTEKQVEVEIDMPGLVKEDVKVTLSGDKLNIVDVGKKIYNQDIEFVLPANCVGGNANAKLKHGILTITVEKTSPTPVSSINVPVTDD